MEVEGVVVPSQTTVDRVDQEVVDLLTLPPVGVVLQPTTRDFLEAQGKAIPVLMAEVAEPVVRETAHGMSCLLFHIPVVAEVLVLILETPRAILVGQILSIWPLQVAEEQVADSIATAKNDGLQHTDTAEVTVDMLEIMPLAVLCPTDTVDWNSQVAVAVAAAVMLMNITPLAVMADRE
jgi:hypothetical protein